MPIPQETLETLYKQYYSNRFIVYFDFLGFSAIVKNNYLKKVIDAFRTAIDRAEITIKDSRKVVIASEVVEPVQGSFWFSDTLILYSGNNSPPKILYNLIPATSYLMASFLNDGFPTRCVITLGQFYVEKDSSSRDFFLGEGLIQAYEMEKKMNWCGGILSPTLCEISDIAQIIDTLKSDKEIIDYDVPLKDGEVKSYQCLRWPKYFHDNFKKDKDDVRRSMTDRMNSPLVWPVEEKIRNTEKFYAKTSDGGNWTP